MGAFIPEKRWTEKFGEVKGLAWLDSKWAGLLIVAALFVFMAALSWRKWADPVIDFGVQLYVPWRIVHGAVLDRDVMYLPGGPLSQYFNALLFRIFGVSFRTLIFANLTITAAMLVLVYRCFLKVADRWTATTIGSVVVIAFAFANYGDCNYNYIAPYCHEALHGLVLSILAVALLSEWVQKKRWPFVLGAGLCYGLVFLTKPEIFLALTAGVLAAFVLVLNEGGQAKCITKSLPVFFLGALAAPLGFFLGFFHVESVARSLRATAFAWVPLLEKPVANDAYYKWCLGLDDPAWHLKQMFGQFFLLAAVVGVYAVFFRRKINSSRDKIIALAAGAVLLFWASRLDWVSIASLPLIGLTLCILIWLNRKKLTASGDLAFPWIWSVFALVLLAKLGLFSRLWHYGFVLAMPATLGAVYLLFWLLPLLLEKYGVQRLAFRRLTWWVAVFACMELLAQSAVHYAKMTFPIGSGGDEIKAATSTGFIHNVPAIAAALAWMNTNTPPRATLAVLPEGALVNYLARRVNPTGYPVWMPPEIAAFGQTNMTSAFERRPPDYVMLIHSENAPLMYKVRYFGQTPEYGLALMQWIRKNYDTVFQEGAVPLQTTNFGLQILKRHGSEKLAAQLH